MSPLKDWSWIEDKSIEDADSSNLDQTRALTSNTSLLLHISPFSLWLFSFILSSLYFIHSFIYPFIHSFIHSSFHSFIHSFLPSFAHSFIDAFMHSFIHSFTTDQSKVVKDFVKNTADLKSSGFQLLKSVGVWKSKDVLWEFHCCSFSY